MQGRFQPLGEIRILAEHFNQNGTAAEFLLLKIIADHPDKRLISAGRFTKSLLDEVFLFISGDRKGIPSILVTANGYGISIRIPWRISIIYKLKEDLG